VKIINTAGNLNPFSAELPYENQGFPLFGLDVFRHAYNDHYRNNVSLYASNYLKVVDWNFVSKRFVRATNSGF
jgi:Fe-Mn family superoxide dismutase